MTSQFRYTEDANGGQGAFRRVGLPYMEDGANPFSPPNDRSILSEVRIWGTANTQTKRRSWGPRAWDTKPSEISPGRREPDLPNLISRADWATIEPNYAELRTKNNRLHIRNVTEIILHHTGSADTPVKVERMHRLGEQDDILGRANAWAKGLKGSRWADVGYHYMIAPNGTIYEGRNISFIGAHVFGHNNNTIGVAFLGDFTNRPITGAALAAFQNLRASLESISGKSLSLATHGFYESHKRDELKGAWGQFGSLKKPIGN
jgi:hypothetical protein